MSRNQSRVPSDPIRTIKKVLLSGFVVFSFMVYIVIERLTRPDSPIYPAATTSNIAGVPGNSRLYSSAPGALPPTDSPQTNLVPAPGVSLGSSGYKNGTYQGQTVDAYYGLVQVQVNIQGGAIKDVQFLQYPNDRRTSQQINSIAMPYLKEEAIQVQSAQVDIVSGATLTSEGFQMSLQSALQAAR